MKKISCVAVVAGIFTLRLSHLKKRSYGEDFISEQTVSFLHICMTYFYYNTEIKTVKKYELSVKMVKCMLFFHRPDQHT